SLLLRLGDLLLVAAAFAQAAAHRTGALGRLLDDERRLALRARLRYRTIPGGEPTLRVAPAGEEDLPRARALLHDLALFAVGTGDPGRHRPHHLARRLAIRIAAAAEELAEAA